MSTPTPTFGVLGLRAACERPKRSCRSQLPLLTIGALAAAAANRCRRQPASAHLDAPRPAPRAETFMAPRRPRAIKARACCAERRRGPAPSFDSRRLHFNHLIKAASSAAASSANEPGAPPSPRRRTFGLKFTVTGPASEMCVTQVSF